MRGRRHLVRYVTTTAAVFGIAALVAGCGSTIHTKDDVAGVHTLSLDAKQRVIFVANRQAGDHERVMCTEPMPDALVARAAVLAGSGGFQQPSGPSGSAGVAGGSSESAASIGYRDQTVQMLRDGYYRLCEAYMNGALTTQQYQDMILNADTFMVVISALQTLGNNPTAPAVAISTGDLSANVPAAGTSGAAPAASAGTSGTNVIIQNPAQGTPPAKDAKNAEMAAQIVSAYLRYRYLLARETARREARARCI